MFRGATFWFPHLAGFSAYFAGSTIDLGLLFPLDFLTISPFFPKPDEQIIQEQSVSNSNDCLIETYFKKLTYQTQKMPDTFVAQRILDDDQTQVQRHLPCHRNQTIPEEDQLHRLPDSLRCRRNHQLPGAG